MATATCDKQLSITTTDFELPEPAAYYAFEELGASVRLDSTANHINLTPDGDMFYAVAKIGHGVRNNFTDQLHDFSGNATTVLLNLNLGFTVCGWVLTGPDVAGNAQLFVIADAAYNFSARISNSKIQMRSNAEGSTADSAYINDLDWHFFRAWYDPADQRMHMQLDMGTIGQSDPFALANSNYSLMNIFGGNSLLNETYLDELGIWTEVLDDTEAAFLYNSGAGRTYPF